MRPARELVLTALTALLAKRGRPRWASRFDAEDAIMDAVLRVLQWESDAPETMPAEEAAARRYAARAVENLLIDQLRQTQRQPPSAQAVEQLPSAESTEEDEDNLLLGISERLLAELADQQRELLRAYFAGSDYFREESTRQQLSPNAARVRIHRLLRRLRERGERLASELP